MGYLGEKIREAREEQNLTLRDAALSTKIKTNYLQALEGGDYANLPPRAYVKGFLKIYARYLNIDYPLLLQLYDEEFESQDAQVIFAETKRDSPLFLPGVQWKSVAGILGAAIVIALIVWGGIRLLKGSESSYESSLSFSRVDNPYTPETIERIPVEEVPGQ